jgi:hypothetical protein
LGFNGGSLRRFRRFGRLKAARAVAAIAEGPILGMAATAQGDRLFARGNLELIADMIDDPDRALNHIGSMFSTTDNERLGHGSTSPAKNE